MTMLKRSLFVTFEGGEGAGKSSLISSLKAALSEKKLPVYCTREPGGSLLGDQIRQLLLQQEKGSISNRAELLLFLASRAQHVDKIIKPALASGHVVLCDRFNDSTLAYQGTARGIDISAIEQLCAFAAEDLSPEITFLLDIDPKIGIKRLISDAERSGIVDRIESEEFSFHQRVRQGFLEIAKKNPQRIHVIDASRTEASIFEEVFSLILKKIVE